MYLQSFINYLKFEKRSSVHTINSYQRDIEQYEAHLSLVHKTLLQADYRDVRLWIADLMKENKPKSINRKISTLKSFYNFLLKRGDLKINPAANMSNLKEPKRTPSFVSEKEINAIFENLPEPTNYFEHRDQIIFEMFYNTGMRREELLNLEDKHIDFFEQTILVYGKGKKERKIPLHLLFLKEIKTYLSLRNEFKGNQTNDFLFLTKTKKKLSPKNVYTIINKTLSMCTSVNKKSPHILRHTFATHLLNNGADLNAIKELLGHSSLAATQIYTSNSIEKLKEIHKQAHPKA